MKSIVLALVLVGLVGCGGKPTEVKPVEVKPAQTGKLSSTTSKQMTREEFEAKIKGLKTAQDFIDAFGKPASTQQDSTEIVLIFSGLTKDAITGKADSRVWVTFTGQGTNAVYNRHSFS